jgi:riboflavin kinase/FMN adenylyltransferase
MKLVKSIDKLTKPFKNAVITIGNFDGVHKGHQILLAEVRKKARAIGGTAIAMTFEPHPIAVLKKENHPPLITMYEQKIELLSQHELDVLICLPFTKKFSEISADEFVKDILVSRIGMKAIVVGNDYHFGQNRGGGIDLLKSHADQLDFKVIVVDWEKISDTWTERISSTKIREVVMQGKVEEAVNLLGRYYQLRGRVVGGRDRGGKLLGFPTANIHLIDELSPKIGVYAVTVECEGEKYNGVANIGYSPTFDDYLFTVEVHILDFRKDIYGQNIRVNFISRLRDEKKFSDISELSDQIERDIAKARDILF